MNKRYLLVFGLLPVLLTGCSVGGHVRVGSDDPSPAYYAAVEKPHSPVDGNVNDRHATVVAVADAPASPYAGVSLTSK